MNKIHFVMILAVALSINACYTKKQQATVNEPSITETLYFGQKPPGLIPEVFAPGIVSVNGRFEGAITFSPDLDEMYFGADNEHEATEIYFSKREGNQWTSITKVNFTKGKDDEEMHPFVSPDGKSIYFTAHSPASPEPKIWEVKRLGNAWSNAVKLDSPINVDPIFYPNQSKNGDLFYFNLSNFKTYYASRKNNSFSEAKEVDIPFGHHGFIAPSQEYLVITSRNKEDAHRKDNDIYVYFKKQDGGWTKPIHLGAEINSNFNEKCPSITPDGNYLFFGRDERNEEPGLSNIHWVSTEVIHQLKPTNL
ncbi:TolB family protein [Spongiimicrobium salis]|uniref:TolB family protein n=1 Tax=Spongiimicrobium salis TaxID=1667022 RepID=UPI00374D71F6